MQTTYFSFLHEILSQCRINIVALLQGSGNLEEDFVDYHQVFLAYQGGFGFGGWVFYILMMLFCIGIVVCLGLFIYTMVRKIIVRSKGARREREGLLLEIERLNLQVYELARHQGGAMALPQPPNALPGAKTTKEARFARLAAIDAQYQSLPVVTQNENDDIRLQTLCSRFRDYAASNLHLYYELGVIRAFIAALATTKLIILEGASGTGKTSLPYSMSRFLDAMIQLCPVQPSWREKSDLLGYYNEFSQKFMETDFLAALYESTYRDVPSFIVLDEMNLSRVEYYFADFLSILELPEEDWRVRVAPRGEAMDPLHLEEGSLRIGDNVFFIGTANNDDSTFTITDKVYDRSFALSFEARGQAFQAPPVEPIQLSYASLRHLFDEAKANFRLSGQGEDAFRELDEFMRSRFELGAGSRVLKQLHVFVACFRACGGEENEALDFFFESKALGRLRPLIGRYRERDFLDLDSQIKALFGTSFPRSTSMVASFLKRRK